jgi:predicted cupin superfamily sugar epimerase
MPMPGSHAGEWIRHLHMQKHVEGGWYSEVYRSPLILEKLALSPALTANRSACTHIYFLLEQNDFSTLHRIRSDELWHFYDGDNLIVYELDASGRLTEHKLGKDIANGFLPFCMISKGSWFGARVADGGSFSLVGCTVSPGFEFEDLELAKAEILTKKYPDHSKLIRSLCR